MENSQVVQTDGSIKSIVLPDARIQNFKDQLNYLVQIIRTCNQSEHERRWTDNIIRNFRTSRANSDSNLKYRNPKYLSILNHLRFYLPEIYSKLDKIVFLDDDIVVKKDLSGLWSTNMKGKVNGAVETCGQSFHRFDRYLNFSNPLIANNFNPHACGLAFGMNVFVFDLAEWRPQYITQIYHHWQKLNRDRTLWKLGTLPPGLITFWNKTFPLSHSGHGIGYNPHVSSRDIASCSHTLQWQHEALARDWPAQVPKLLVQISDYDQPFLRECNINP